MIVHPPGGLAAGDALRLRIDLEEGARVRSSTPGSQKWYRGRASARTHIRVARGAQLEWLPQPSIVYDGAFVDQSLQVDLDTDCAMLGSECLVLGRRSMGERFTTGSLRQSIRINRAGRPIWQESTDAAADALLWGASAGWAGRVVCASVWAIGGHGAAWDDASLVDQWRAAISAATATEAKTGLDGRLLGGATRMAPGIVLAKILGDEADRVSELAQALWALARPPVLGEAAHAMRIWAT
jgi:urease accessory protein